MDKKPRSFLEITNRGKSKKGFRNTDSNKDDFSINQKIQEYSSAPENSAPVEKSYFSPREEIDYFKEISLTPNFIEKVDSDSREISKNNKNLEQKIKAELAGVNIFKKGGHLLKTITSRGYREQTADDLIKHQLNVAANFRDSIKIVYLNLDNELNKNVKNLDNLEREYFQNISEREKTKKNIQKTRKDHEFLKKVPENKRSLVEKEELNISIKNVYRTCRKEISKLDELNNAIVNNIEERGFNYDSEIIFERFEGAFKKIYDTAESELRKIDRVKGLYLYAMKGGKIVKKLEKSFEDVFSSLRLMDNVLLKGINSLMENSSHKNRIRELRDEKNENSKILLKTLKENYIPSAEQLNALVENYIRGGKGGMERR